MIVCAFFGIYLVTLFFDLKRYSFEWKAYLSEALPVRRAWLHLWVLLSSIPSLVVLSSGDWGPYERLAWMIFPLAPLLLLILLSMCHRNDSSLSESKKAAASFFFSRAQLDEWKGLLEKHAHEKKLYLNPKLRLAHLAKGLKLKPYQVSEILNRGMRTTFYEFINGLRVQEVQKRLLDMEFANCSVLEIAMESGFNSKSVFNDAFRKMTGLTPQEYRKINHSK